MLIPCTERCLVFLMPCWDLDSFSGSLEGRHAANYGSQVAGAIKRGSDRTLRRWVFVFVMPSLIPFFLSCSSLLLA